MKRSSRIVIFIAIIFLFLGYADKACPGPKKPPMPSPTSKIATVAELARATIESAQLSIAVMGVFGTVLSVIIALASILGFKNFYDSRRNRQEAEEKFSAATSLSEALVTAQAALTGGSLIIDCNQAIKDLEAIAANYSTHRTLHIYLGRLYRRLGDYDNAISSLRKFVNNIECDPRARNTPEAKIDIADANYNIACYHALKAEQESRGKNREAEIKRLVEETILFLRVSIEGNPRNQQGAWKDPDFDYSPVRKRVIEEFGEQPEGD